SHSISPQIYAAGFPAVGVDGRCDPWAIEPSLLGAAIERLRGSEFFGACITVPHKEALIPFIDELDDLAARVAAVNCIVSSGGRLQGHNTDLYGFMRALTEAGFNARGRSALLLGHGGAARAVVVGLLDAGIGKVALTGRSAERAQAAAGSLALATGTSIQSIA